MRKLLLSALIALGCSVAHAQCTIASGASTSTIQTAINSAASNSCAGPITNEALFSANGSWTIGSQISIPCPGSAGLIIQGVAPSGVGNTWPITPTASLTGTMTNTAGFAGTACANGTTIQYLHWNGGEPSGGGGGFLYVPAGMNKLTVQYNWIEGIQGIQPASNIADTMIWLDGVDTNGSTRTENTTIQWNRLGTAGSNDCSNLMNVLGGNNACVVTVNGGGYTLGGSGTCWYQDGASEKDAGGYCAAVGIHAKTDNLNISNNSIAHVEQGLKFFEGCGSTTCPDQFDPTNLVVNANDFTQTHRITIEAQQTPSTGGFTVTNNDQHDQVLFGGVSWGQSLPQGSIGAVNGTYTNNNLLIENNLKGTDKYGVGAARSYCDEFWGSGSTFNNNICQGYWGGGAAWGYGGSGWTISNNTFQQATNYFENYISDEEGCTGCGDPTGSGNVETHSISTITSVSPTISPAAGAQTFPLTVTLTDPGYTSGSLPLGNTGIWYTTDGSTPTPGTGTAKYLSSGGTFVLPSAATVKAVGMWGALNQPASYPSGYGFVPSATQSATYTGGLYISPTGSDANPGTMASPWLTPNHSLTCGQTITALSGTYSASNFQSGKWGTVSCPSGNNVVWLQCQTFDTCKITATGSDGMWVDQSYWGVQGWEISTNTTTSGACFHAGPSGTSTIHHIIFANNVANGCMGGGFTAYNKPGSTTASVDYITYLGNVAYNAAQGTAACYSGINIYQPIASDTNAGTHMYVAGNFSYDNVDGTSCDSAGAGKTTDGEGVNFDTFDFSQGGGTAYAQQAVAQNNIEVLNGTRGMEVENNTAGSSHANIYFKYNTAYGSGKDPNMAFPAGIAEIGIIGAQNVSVTNNLVYTGHQFTTGTNGYYALGMTNGNGTDTVSSNYASGVAGNNTYLQTSTGFSYGSNTLGTNPSFASTADPGAPSCGSFASVPACMATLVAHFTPSASGASAYGYQAPSGTSVVDALYPQWLCNVTLPSGLVTPGCGSAPPPTLQSGYQGNSGNVNTLSVGQAAVQQLAIGSYSDGSQHDLPDSYGNSAVWSSSDGSILQVTTSGMVSCLAPGSAISYVQSSPGNIHFVQWNWTCNAATNPTLTGGFQTNPGSGNTLAVGGIPVQQTAVGTYSDSVDRNLPDAYGNTAVWSAVNTGSSVGQPAVLNVTSTGQISCLTAGTANSQVISSPGSVAFSPWGWTCNANPVSSGLVCVGAGSPSSGLPGPGGTSPTQGLPCE